MNKAEDKKNIDINGFWEIKHNPISKVGVFPYYGKQISPELEPNKVYYVYRPQEELFKEETKQSFKLIPIVDEHTMLGNGDGLVPAENKGVHGTTGEEVENDNNLLYINLKIYSEELKNLIENGKKELSCGYYCKYELKDGEYNGEHYDAIQRDIKGNHIALVENGRMGADVRVMDSGGIINNYNKENMDKREEIREVEAMLFKAKKDPSKLTDELIKTIISKMENNSYEGDSVEEEKKDEIVAENKEEVKDVENNNESTSIQEVNKKIDLLLELLTKEDSTDSCSKDEEKKEEVKDEEVKDEEKKEEVKDEEVKDEDKEEKKSNAMDSLLNILADRENLYNDVRKVVGDFDYKKMSMEKIAKYACDKLDLNVKNNYIPFIKGYLANNKKDKSIYSMNGVNNNDDAINKYMKGE